MKVPLMRDTFLRENDTCDALSEFVRTTPRLSMGPVCLQFEQEFAAWQGRKHAVLVNSGSSANLLLIQALLNMGGLKRGDRVGVSALTWATNVMPIVQLGMEPVVCDVFTKDFRAEQDGRTADLYFLTHALGWPAIYHGARDMIIEDTCEALGTETGGVRCGNFGLASTFSFYVGHHLSTIEGGMVCTDDHELAVNLRVARAHGWDRDLDQGSRTLLRAVFEIPTFHAPYTFYGSGFNLRPTEITGFLGLTQLPLMDEAIKRRELLYSILAKTKAYNPDFLVHDRGHIKTLSAFCFPVVCKTPALRAQYVQRFTEAGVEVRPLIAGNIQRHPFWKKAGLPQYPTPGADYLHENAFYAPLRPDLTEEEIMTIEGCLR